ncbi:LysR family transcriptional regulator [Pseudomonas solani]|uniref:LysR family transcriptional regulator n=1 Tax=Pseudomonas solani TaxID=2731552 RepID=UPI0035BE600B
MNLHHLKVFLAVAESGSISGGAERLHISQPAVTREVRELEARLGITLFDRQPRGVTLTEGGLRLHRYAQRIFALEQAAEADLRSFAGLDDGELRLGASATLGSYLLPDLIARFHARHPEIRVDLQVSNTREITQALADERIALGFVEGDFDRTTHAFRLLERDRLLPVCSPTHALAGQGRLAATELASQALYLREEGSGTRASIEQAYAHQGLEVRARMAIASTEALKRLVRDGQGIAWLSQRVIDDDLAAGRLVALEVEDLRIERELHLLWHPTRTLSPAPAAFLAAILDKK